MRSTFVNWVLGMVDLVTVVPDAVEQQRRVEEAAERATRRRYTW
jgi:hypothetical protein